MSNENEPKPPQSPGNTAPEPEHSAEQPAAHHMTQAERDEEIAAIQQHARKQHPGIERPPELPPVPPRKAALMAGVALLVLLAGGGFTLLDRFSRSRVLARETEQSAVPTLAVVHPLAEKPDVELVLPGSLLAFKESPIYARTNGYLLRWYKDIGSQVKKGELLAQIDTPEVDQELNQARAAQQQMQAAMELAKITAARWENLRKTDSVSAQEADQQSSAYTQSRANLAAADGQRAPPGRAGIVQERLRAVHRRAHPPQRRSRRADRLPEPEAKSSSTLPRSIPCASLSASRRLTRPSSRSASRPPSRCRSFPAKSSTPRWLAPPRRSTRRPAPC